MTWERVLKVIADYPKHLNNPNSINNFFLSVSAYVTVDDDYYENIRTAESRTAETYRFSLQNI